MKAYLNLSPKEFKSDAGRFSVISPVAMKEMINPQKINGLQIDQHIFWAAKNNIGYFVCYSDDPRTLLEQNDPDKVLDACRNGVVSNTNGNLIIETKMLIDGHPGRELLIDSKDTKGQDWTTKARVFLVKNRIYSIFINSPKGRISGIEINDFLESFKLIEK